MAKIAYILLCHKDPEGIIAQAERLTAVGDYIAIHFDARAKTADFEKIRAALASNANVTFAKRRVKCGWGEWSLVEATLQAVRSRRSIPFRGRRISTCCRATACRSNRPNSPMPSLTATMSTTSKALISSIRTGSRPGIKEERLIYRHLFNERTHKTAVLRLDATCKTAWPDARKVPADIGMQIGSQWWCLRRRTVEWVLDFCSKRRDVMRFFRTTWIPDETFFQTLVRHLVPEHEIRSRTLTFLMFTDYGMPVTFYNDNYDLLLSQDYLFARKISPDAKELKDRLGKLYAAKGERFAISNEGRSLFKFLTGRGRVGRRFAPRFWETESSLGRERTLMMVTCKKWHVAKRLVDRVRQVTNLPALDYLFNEASTPLPDLGGIQSTLEKRTRHRRALMRMLFDYWQTDQLVVCIDPANVDLMQDFYNDKAKVRLLEVECDFTDDYLIGHAKRVGLASDSTPPETIERLLPTIRYDVRFESDRMRDAGFRNLLRLRESATVDENTVPLAEFLDIPLEKAREIAATEYLFVD